MNKIVKFLRKAWLQLWNYKIISGFVFVALLAIGYWYLFGNSTTTSYVFASVEKRDIVTSVDGSGQIEGTHQVEVVSEASGIVTKISVKPGDEVVSGQILAELDRRLASIKLEQAQISYEQAEFDLKKTKQSLVDTKAEQNLSLTNKEVSLNSLVTASPDKYNHDTDIVKLTGFYDSTIKGTYTIETYGCSGGVCYWITGLEYGGDIVDLGNAKKLGTRGLYISFTSMPITGQKWTVEVPSPLASGYLSTSNSYNEAVQNAKTTIANQELSVESSELSLRNAKLSLASAKMDYDNTYVRAPFAGQIGKIAIKVGEQIGSGTSVATLSAKDMQAHITLNEVDAASVVVGQKVNLTFDALSDINIVGSVSQIDTIGTESSGVVLFDVYIAFDTKDARIKSGMSASAKIVTKESIGVASVPASAVKTINNKSYVETQDENGDIKKVFVKAGLSDDSFVEILEGLSLGQKVITKTVSGTSTKTNTSSAKTSTTGVRATGGMMIPR